MTQSASPPPYQQPYVQPKPPVEYLKPLASDFLLAIGITVGLFLMMIGAIIVGLTTGGGRDVGNIIESLGTFIITAALFLGAIVRVDIDKLVRFGFILAAALIIIIVGFW